MKDIRKRVLESERPKVSADYAVGFCLEQLYADKKRCFYDTVAGLCTYQELIGALLLARDAIQEREKLEKELSEYA